MNETYFVHAVFEQAVVIVAFMLACLAGVKTEEIRNGRIYWGVQGYLEGIFRDPSPTKVQGNVEQPQKI